MDGVEKLIRLAIISVLLLALSAIGTGAANSLRNADDPHCPAGTAWVFGPDETKACVPVTVVVEGE